MDYGIRDYEWKSLAGDDSQEANARLLHYVYTGQCEGDSSHRVELSLDNLDDYINFQLEMLSTCPTPPLQQSSSQQRLIGRLGPKHVVFDVSSNVGSLVIDKDRLGVSSQSNFSSIRANCCVYAGRWQYELMLGSKGVMQVGWATTNCKFSQEKGVGDTPDSYSYDGNRVQKWNVVTSKYGEPWLAGDVIGCTLDLDSGTGAFYRNGRCLGRAFDRVKLGPGLAYFPAVSLVFNENLVANFGALPFRYPVSGFSPLEEVPLLETQKAGKLLYWLERFLPFYDQQEPSKQMIPEHGGWMHLPERGKKASMLLLVTPLMQHLGPLLSCPYVTEHSFLPFLFKLCNLDLGQPIGELHSVQQAKVGSLLEVMWALLEPQEVELCLEHLVSSLFIGYRFSRSTPNFYYQRCHLLLTLAILKHEKTCLYLLQNVLFDKTRFPALLEVKQLDMSILEELVPVIWYDTSAGDSEQDSTLDAEEEARRSAYRSSYGALEESIAQLQSVQFQILQQLFRTSFRGEQSCRTIFLNKFAQFLKDNSGGSRIPMVQLCQLSVALSFFQQLVLLLRQHLECLSSEGPVFVPTEVFYNGCINYSDIHRVGGLMSHLQKLYQEELRDAMKWKVIGGEAMETSDDPSVVVGGVWPKGVCDRPPPVGRRDKEDHEVLIELLDGIVRLYVISAHRQLEKMCQVRETMHEYVHALKDVESRLSSCSEVSDVREALLQAREVFLKKLSEQSRQAAWVCSLVYCRQAREDVYWLLHIVLETLEKAVQSGPFFSFVPDFYVEACIKSCNALRSFFTLSMPVMELAHWEATLTRFGVFLALNFANPRIVNADLKDSLVQAFAAFVCQPSTLKALESMPQLTQLVMVRALLQPYENRAWAQSNWILVRLWKGCGFAFRYTIPPHLVRRLGMTRAGGRLGGKAGEDVANHHHRPCPSPLFQRQVSNWLRENPDAASSFLSSILNQLNWAFSEFIGMLQEIQNATNRPERVFIDSRQLKICATCFDLALALLRVLEMALHLNPELLTDPGRPSTEILLTRLCQLLCQVLNRVTSRSGCFELVVSMDIPGLETVNHFPILVAVAGILLSLVDNGSGNSRERATQALLAEPSFQPTSLDFLLPNDLGMTMETDVSAPSTSSTYVNPAMGLENYDMEASGSGGGSSARELTELQSAFPLGHPTRAEFSLSNYPEVSRSELVRLRDVISRLHLRHRSREQNEPLLDEDTLCTICYASAKSATFRPCSHQSCRSCISLHLLAQRDCFFCKAPIEAVISNVDGAVIYTPK